MKKNIFILFFAFACPVTFAQVSYSNADMLSTAPGVVIQKVYINIGKIRNLSILTEHITDLTHGKKLSALDLEYAYNGANSATFAVLLDPGEVDSLVAFLQNLQQNISKAGAPAYYTEYSFITKSGFEAGCYWDNAWKIYVKINYKNGNSDFELNKDEFMAFISFVKQARTKM